MNRKTIFTALFLILVLSAAPASAQSTAFTYQGKLSNNNTPATGNFDFEFRLFDASGGGAQQGTTVTVTNVAVASGIFTVQLDFGACPTCFNGAARFLEVAVRPAGGGSYTTLAPRQPITSTPYAIKTPYLTANGAYDDGTFIFTAANAFVGDRAGINTVPNPILNNSLGKWNSFFGAGAGQANTEGSGNAFLGFLSGLNNTTGSANSFFGSQAGVSNSSGLLNTFIGQQAGYNNTFGNTNTFIGVGADFNSINPIGNGNTLLGIGTKINSGVSNGTAIGGRALVTQSNSLILGGITGINGGTDTFVGIGTTAPVERLHVVGNGLFTGNLTVNGTLNANLPAGSSNYIQNQNAAPQSGNFNISGNGTAGGTLNGNVVNATTQFNIGGSPVLRFQLASANLFVGNTGQGGTENSFFGFQAGFSNQTACCNSFFGRSAGQSNTLGIRNSFFGLGAGFGNTTGFENTAIGDVAGDTITVGARNTFLGAFADASADNLSNATAIGAYAQVTQSNSLVLGSINGVNGATADTNVGIGTTAPVSRLHLNGNSGSFTLTLTNSANTVGRRGYRLAFDNDRFTFQRADDAGNFAENQVAIDQATGNVGIGNTNPTDKLNVNGNVSLLLAGGGNTSVCQNSTNFRLAVCSSSQRYKANITSLHTGLSLIDRLRPVTFDWKQGGEHDLGLIAEEVAKVEPLLVTHNDKGEIEGVKYDRVGVLLINAVKEQQAQIAAQQAQLKQQQQQIEALNKLVCRSHRKAKVCK